MQNQVHNPPSFPTQQPNNPGSYPKYGTPAPFKVQDRTLPTQNVKHYASNPNLSLDINNLKTSQFTSESSGQSPNTPKKTTDFRSPPSHSNYPHSQPPPLRGARSQMTQSLIIGDQNNVQTPEEMQTPKKESFRNTPKKQYRMSETIDDLPNSLFAPKKEGNKESNFYKKESMDEKLEGFRQVPKFLNRDKVDMKKSQVVESTFQSNRLQQSLEFPKKKPVKPRKTCVDDFVRIKQLGSGKYGRVYLVRQKYSNFVCALKVIEKKLLHEEDITQQFIRQVKIQMFLNHPNIIKLYGCFDDPTNIYIILEVGTGGQLYHQLKKAQPLSQSRIAFIMRQVCEAVNQIHSLRIIHRDIKPQNIVLHDNIIKLCDFGWSVHQDNKLRTTFCGTPLYVCPEILKGREYDEKIDIWSIGIMMYEMVVGQNPFKITREEELIKIVKDEIKIPSYLFVSVEVRDFLDRCLQKNPDERAVIKELVNHAFFKKHQEKNQKSKSIQL